MKFFGQRAGNTARPGTKSEERTDSASPSVSRRLTLGLSRAENLALMLANSRAARMVEVADLLAGMYIYDWDRLSRYWRNGDQENIEGYLRLICRISPQRWHFWIQHYHYQQHPGAGRRKWRPLERFLREQPPARFLRQSTALAAILKEAEKIAPSHDTVDGRRVPILTSECVLLCIARDSESEISRKLATTGMDLAALARDALFPKHAPLD
ncbi:MAG: hypothetical protein WA175_02125 [Candidatus Acidiferrales bacterium]